MDADTARLLADSGLELSEPDRAFFERLRACVVRGNERMNLTRLVEPRDFYIKHVLDSALPFLVIPELVDLPHEDLLVADAGSGAGFPGFVVARLFPGWDTALIERTQKKAEFLEETVEELEFANAHVVPFDAREAHRHAEVLDRGCDLVLARAVGRLGPVTKAVARLLKPGGLIVHYKGGTVDADELAEGKRAARKARCAQSDPIPYPLPPDARRSVVLSRSTRRTRTAGRRRKRATRRSPCDRAQ